MNQSETVRKWLTSIVYLAVGVMLFFVLYRINRVLGKSSGGSVAGIVDQADIAMKKINAPCKDTGHQIECGTLAEVGQSVKNTGILSAQGAAQIKQSGTLIKATTENINSIGESVRSLIPPLSGTITALGTTATTATGTLGAATTTIQAAQPLLTNAGIFVADLNTETKPVLAQANLFMGNVNTLSLEFQPLVRHLDEGVVTADHMAARFDQVETKYTQCYLYPTFPCVAKGLLIPGFQLGASALQIAK